MFSKWQKDKIVAVTLVMIYCVVSIVTVSASMGNPPLAVPANANGSCPSGYVPDPGASASTKCRISSYNPGRSACPYNYERDDKTGRCEIDSVGPDKDKKCPSSPSMFFEESSKRCKVCHADKGDRDPSPHGKDKDRDDDDKNKPKKCP